MLVTVIALGANQFSRQAFSYAPFRPQFPQVLYLVPTSVPNSRSHSR
jgi:hypothetical protein